MTITRELFGLNHGKEIYEFTFVNAKGNRLSVLTLGGIVSSWLVRAADGAERNIVAGFLTAEEYIRDDAYIGSIAGRYANRIAKGKFTLQGQDYTLSVNNGANHLHGGTAGFNKKIWNAEVTGADRNELTLTYRSIDGEEGYPGNVDVQVTYSYSDNDELSITYVADTDRATPFNITNHSYFNLTGDMSRTIDSHAIEIAADHFTPTDETQIPTGELRSVRDTPFDFRNPDVIGGHYTGEAEGGFDHNFVLRKKEEDFSYAAAVTDPEGALRLSVYTSEPGIQFYTGNFLNGGTFNRDGKALIKHGCFCLETQHFPDSPNHPNFPSAILKPGKRFHSRTIYKIDMVGSMETGSSDEV